MKWQRNGVAAFMDSRTIYIIRLFFLAFGAAAAPAPALAQPNSEPAPAVQPALVALWPEGSTNNPASGPRPHLEIYRPFAPRSDVSTTIIILPGGGYRGLSPYDRLLAEYFRSIGYAAVVVDYRVMPQPFPAALVDAAHAIRLLRVKGSEWKIPTQRLVLFGESAGGHLASLLGIRPDYYIDATEDLRAISSRVDGLILMSAVVSTVASYKYNLDHWLGGMTADQRAEISPELHVERTSPRAIIFHAADDDGVSCENSIELARSYWSKGASAELHVFPHGRHGYRFTFDVENSRAWHALVETWLGGGR